MPCDGFGFGEARRGFFKVKKVAENLRVAVEFFFENGDATLKVLRNVDAAEAKCFGKLDEYGGDVAIYEPVVGFVRVACDEGVDHSQAQISYRLFAEEFFELSVGFEFSEWIGTIQDAVVAFDAGKFCGEGASAAIEAHPTEDERIDGRPIAEHPRNRGMGNGVGFVQDDEEVDVGDAFDRIAANCTAVKAAGIEVLVQFGTQCSEGIINQGLLAGSHWLQAQCVNYCWKFKEQF